MKADEIRQLAAAIAGKLPASEQFMDSLARAIAARKILDSRKRRAERRELVGASA